MNYFGLQCLTEPLQITFYVWAVELVVLILFVACLPLFNLNFSFPQPQCIQLESLDKMGKDNKFRNTFTKLSN